MNDLYSRRILIYSQSFTFNYISKYAQVPGSPFQFELGLYVCQSGSRRLTRSCMQLQKSWPFLKVMSLPCLVFFWHRTKCHFVLTTMPLVEAVLLVFLIGSLWGHGSLWYRSHPSLSVANHKDAFWIVSIHSRRALCFEKTGKLMKGDWWKVKRGMCRALEIVLQIAKLWRQWSFSNRCWKCHYLFKICT